MTGKKKSPVKQTSTSVKSAAEAAYSEAIFRHSVGDKAGALAALERSLQLNPNYAPAILTMGSVEYQLQQQEDGKRLLFSLVSLPRKTENLFSIIAEAGSFLISVNAFADGFELYRKAAHKFADVAEFHHRASYCAAQEGMYDEALALSRQAIELDPTNAAYLSDMGWTLLLAERYQDAEATLLRALEFDPSNEHALANLQYCRERLTEFASTAADTTIQSTPATKKRKGAAAARKKRAPQRA